MPGWKFYRPQKWIRVSAVSEYIRCPRRFFYHYGCGLVPNEERLALTYGEAIHAALGWLLRTPGDLAGAVDRFKNVWQDRDKYADEKRNTFNGIRLLTIWLSQHNQPRQSIYEAFEPPTPVSSDGTPILIPTERQSDFEVPFAIDIGLGIPLVGRIDALARHRDTREVWTVEFKTTSELSTRFFEGFRLNPQALLYNLACRSSGIQTRGTFVEALCTSKTKPAVQVQPIYVQDYNVSAMLKLLRWKVQEMLHMEAVHDFPKDFTGCNSYGAFGMPGYNCDYMKLCEVEDWTTFKGMYQELRDEPFLVKESTNESP